jgi:glycerol transport system ATP-binding protein
MTRGRAVQVGSADELFERPSHTFVGHFIGSPGMNFLRGHVAAGRLSMTRHPLALPPTQCLPDGEITLGVRPEYVDLAEPGSADALPGTLSRVQVGDQVVKARVPASTPAQIPAPGATVWLRVMTAHTCFYRNEERV